MKLTMLRLIALAVPASAAVMSLPAAAQDFSGAYAGAAISADRFKAEDQSYGDGSVDVNGTGISVFGGYAWQSGSFVYGPEIFARRHDADGDDGSFLRPFTAKTSYGLKARLGYAAGKFLPYLSAGVLRTKVKADHNGAGSIAKDTAKGVSIAVGLDWAVTERSLLRFEVERTNYSDSELDWSGDTHDYKLDATTISIGYALRF